MRTHVRPGLRPVFQSILAILFILSACSPQTATPTAMPAATDTQAAAAPSGPLAPDGQPNQTYYAPFPVKITLDGDLADWQGVPTVTVPAGADPNNANQPSITFAAAADDKNMYMMANVADNNIISGKHGTNYWNEDSVEFYINATGDLSATDYNDAITQITIPALNIGKTPETAVFGGINSTTQGALASVVKTKSGYAVELSVPLVNKNWDLTPSHGKTIGFQADLNGGSVADRDTKLTWSSYDKSDQSYRNPSLFGQLIFYEIGKTDKPVFNPTPLPPPTATIPPPAANSPYKDASLPIAKRVDDLLAQMSLPEKIGQMTLVEKNSIGYNDLANNFIGGVLSGGGGSPNINTPKYWASMVDLYQKNALSSRLGIPMIYGVDAVHGHNNVRGAVIFPHNIGLGAANDPDLMTRIGRVTASEMIATGIYWDYAPVLAVAQDIRWGRTYESYSENTELVSSLSSAYIKGLQGSKLSDPNSVAATLKHFVGDGGTAWGSSTTGDYKLDQGVTQVDEATLRAIHLPPYIAGIKTGAQIVMVSYSSWGGMKMHAQKHLITDVLKGELGFSGFVVSDWGGEDQISSDYYQAVVTATNAGVDMNMVPYDYHRFIKTLTSAVQKGDVPTARIDDAVRRILTVKFEMGLFDHPYSNKNLVAQVGSDAHRAVAREAVSKTLVLLKNENTALPLAKNTPLLYVAGTGANDIGMQTGGWTITWQGAMGDTTPGTTLLQAIQKTVSKTTKVQYDANGSFPAGTQADACVAVVGETPYAEGVGDKADLSLTAADNQMIAGLRPVCKKLVVLLYSGRPMIINDALAQSDAFVAAWLPGTEGQGLADVLFGDKPFTGKLSFTWPRSNDQLPFDFKNLGSGDQGPLFPFGYGLTDK